MKKVYLYDELGFFTEEYFAQQSPLESGVFIAPELSTDIAPIIQANIWPKFVNGAWLSEPDYRGVVWDTITGERVTHIEIGVLPSNLTATPKPAGYYHWINGAWVVDLEAEKTAKIAIIEQAYNDAIQINVTYNGVVFQADQVSQDRLVKVITALNGATPAGFFWTALDNSNVPMSYADLKGLSAVILAQGWAAFQKMKSLKNSINAASDIDAVSLITWS